MAFTYIKAGSIKEASKALKDKGTVLIAGGTDLLPRMRNETVNPRILVDITGINELKMVDISGNKVRLGAGVKLCDLVKDEKLNHVSPELLKAIKRVASPQIRNAATLGGNLCQFTRCQYFNQSYHWRENIGLCYRAGGDVCFQRKNSPTCVASFYSDIAPILVAAEAKVIIAGENGIRKIELVDLYQKDGSLALDSGELVTAIEYEHKNHQGWSFIARNLRRTIDFGIGMAAAIISVDPENKNCLEVAIVLGAVAPYPYKSREAEDLLSGSKLNDQLICKAAELAVKDIMPVPEPFCTPKYKKHLLTVLTERAIKEAYQEALKC